MGTGFFREKKTYISGILFFAHFSILLKLKLDLIFTGRQGSELYGVKYQYIRMVSI